MTKPVRVLIADDNREFCELLKEFLNQQPDFELVGVAYNGMEAVEAIEKTRPDVVILD
ncbi:MAG: response regulator, partial [Thermoanaerobacteraceae bacterium]|nr:response regulator [Thermoanaerobacteraceae bacterium]